MITTPVDRFRCDLWTNEPPNAAALTTACGFEDASDYRVDVIPLGGGPVLCTQEAESLPTIAEACGLPLALDQYVLRIMEPNFHELICSILIEHDGTPTRSDIADACGSDALARYDDKRAVLEFMGSKPKPETPPPPACQAPPLQFGFGIYDQAPDLQHLWTNEPLTWLAGRLIWFGMVKPKCEGGRSGLDPYSLLADACGMAAAREAVTAWQNQFNADIYQAALKYQVPARLIKRIIAVESQYWPMWQNIGGESGMLQVSTNGVDVLLRYDPDLDPQYPRRPVDQQYWKRLEVLQVLACAGCSLSDALAYMHYAIPIYARLLAAYRCRAVEMNPGLAGSGAWRQATIDYNGNPDYIGKVE